jgi:hypothetical protein
MQVTYLKMNKSSREGLSKFLYIYNQNKIVVFLIKINHVIIVLQKSIQNMIHLKNITIMNNDMLISLKNNFNHLLNKKSINITKAIYIEKIT